jgi:3',5'-cyclic AMP phosphodiesterase CpdA
VAAHVEAALDLARGARWDAIVMSGDVSQRAREPEFREARLWLDRFAGCAPVMVVPGNHDTAWWHAPFGWGEASALHARYREHISAELEPVLHLPGLSLVGLNSALGMLPPALTWYPRDWRVKGGLTHVQIDAARRKLAEAPPDSLRMAVVHHNVVKGRLSKRWGLARPQQQLDALAALDVDVICSGHDHEERLELVTRATGQFVASTANTLSNRMRGHRPSAVTVIEANARELTLRAWPYDPAARAFAPGPLELSVPRRSRQTTNAPHPMPPRR